MPHRQPAVITPAEIALLEECVRLHAPELAPLLAKLGRTPLTDDEREDLRGAVVSELVSTGLDEEDEANARGQMLDDVIGRLGDV